MIPREQSQRSRRGFRESSNRPASTCPGAAAPRRVWSTRPMPERAPVARRAIVALLGKPGRCLAGVHPVWDVQQHLPPARSGSRPGARRRTSATGSMSMADVCRPTRSSWRCCRVVGAMPVPISMVRVAGHHPARVVRKRRTAGSVDPQDRSFGPKGDANEEHSSECRWRARWPAPPRIQPVRAEAEHPHCDGRGLRGRCAGAGRMQFERLIIIIICLDVGQAVGPAGGVRA